MRSTIAPPGFASPCRDSSPFPGGRPIPSSPVEITDYDLHLLREGKHDRSWHKLGAHWSPAEGGRGTHFAVWAPSAEAVSVVGDFNGWDPSACPMTDRGSGGIWETFVPAVEPGALYKYRIRPRGGAGFDKADPYAFASEFRPQTASRVWDMGAYRWNDGEWMSRRAGRNPLLEPMSVYEVHLGSWRRVPEEGGRSLTYREAASSLRDYVLENGFTHVEFLPVSEHPFDGSWGYQPVGLFAPTSRFGTPDDFKFLVDSLHQAGIGVLLDWVPAHFPKDPHGLGLFDGTHLFEHADPRQREHRDWGTLVYNYGRWEVRNFLLSNALFWLEEYHVDGLRVDAVASMLYLDYSKKDGEWVANVFGGRENLEAVSFFRDFNVKLPAAHPGTLTVAEESTSWPGVSRPVHLGGLGFGSKWDMGWMNDTLDFFSKDPLFRKYHHDKLTFRSLYAFGENFTLPLSHDEVVHGKRSLLGKMPGDDWQKFANLRLLFGVQHGQPGKKLLFMGGEIAQWQEWSHDRSLDWHLLEKSNHEGVRCWVRDLNRLHVAEEALHALDHDPAGFEWVDCNDSENSTVSWLRWSPGRRLAVLVVANFTPVVQRDYRVGVPFPGEWTERLNSDSSVYGGSGVGNAGRVLAGAESWHGRPASLRLQIPPLGILFLSSPVPL